MSPTEKLHAYEAMQAAIQAEYDNAVEKMVALKAEGKEKTVTYRQLMVTKMNARTLLDYYKIYGLAGE